MVRGQPAPRGEALAKTEGGVGKAEQCHHKNRPAENKNGDVNGAENESTSAGAARDRVQHSKSQHGIGHQE